MYELDPRLWLYLDNLRCGWPPATNLDADAAAWSGEAARQRGFVSDDPKPSRLTRKGEIALRLSLSAGLTPGKDRDEQSQHGEEAEAGRADKADKVDTGGSR